MYEYEAIAKHYEKCFEKYGDCCIGVDWPNQEDADLRYRVMLDIIKSKPCTLLDLGCGLSHLYDFITKSKYKDIVYAGADISEKFVHASMKKYPHNTYFIKDLMREGLEKNFDYIVMIGIFTEKQNLTQMEMFDFVTNMVQNAYSYANKGVAFNVMSKQVDWERSDLFHLPMDDLAWFLYNNMRNFVIRNDYGLYEYTVYIYK